MKSGLLRTVCFIVAWSVTNTVVPALAQAEGNLNIKIADGELKGALIGGVENFFGIPYAAPPTGQRRWTPPSPVEAWSGVRDAGRYGAACPQGAGLDSVRTTDENCLFVNIQRPVGVSAEEKLPVVVLFHGGGWVTGSGNNENLNALVRENKIVGVTMNYRLGNLGFLAHPSLADSRGDVSNYGLMDQVAALKWVNANIGAFGGDPSKVTIGGQSAGGGTACQVLASPAADGLYSQAFIMSGLCQAIPREKAEADGKQIASTLGCDRDTAACLRALPVDQLIDNKKVFSRPVQGTPFLPKSGSDKLKEGPLTNVPLIIGATRNEARSFLTDWETRSARAFTEQQYESFVRENFGANANDVMAVYPYPESPTRYSGSYLVAEVMGKDFLGKAGSRACAVSEITERLAGSSKVWAYEFAPVDGPGWFEVPGYIWGTGHATELPYLIPDRGNFANNGKALDKSHRILAKSMLTYWGNFINTGDPNGLGEQHWPAYTKGAGPIMLLREGGKTVPISLTAIRSSHHCDLWDRLSNQ